MQSLDYDYTDHTDSQQEEADRSLLVKFYHHSVKSERESSIEGRPVFKEKEYIDIRVPGQRDSVIRPASQRDKDRFPRHYAASTNEGTQAHRDRHHRERYETAKTRGRRVSGSCNATSASCRLGPA